MLKYLSGFVLAAGASASTNVVPNSCNDLEDGTYMMKLMDGDEYPLVSIKCSNGYGILDYSHDNEITEYFNTWTQWFVDTAGPTNEYHLNWHEWFLPFEETDDDTHTNFVLSPDCNTCEYDHKRQLHGESTGYFMTGTIWGCFWSIKGSHNCDYDYDTTSCYTCTSVAGNEFEEITDDSTTSQYENTGICPHNVHRTDFYTPTEHDRCSEDETDSLETGETALHLKPSLGLAGQYCVCFKQTQTQYFDSSDEEHDLKNTRILKAQEEKTVKAQLQAQESVNDEYELYQKDFEQGTYRIKKSGTYKIMEDITFDFGANEDSPNAEFAYLPNEDQADDYPGADEYRNAYFLGFFAGITVEADDVVIDLNGKTLAMSDYFYHQQRWFTTIELTTQYFLPGQGIGNFGGDPYRASNVVVKNGVLGLTSHHGIHGNDNNNIEITDVKIQEFESHGIQLNGFSDITLTNVEVGPTSTKVLFSAEYAHMRQLVWRYKKIADEMEEAVLSGEKTQEDIEIQFYGRDEATTMREISDEIELQMNLAWDYVINGNEVNEDSENYDSFVSAKKLFANSNDGLFYGSAQYGIFLNTFGASIFTYNLATNYYSSSATLENVKIHGMRHQMEEYFMFGAMSNSYINPFNAPLMVTEMVEGFSELTDSDGVSELLKAPRYKGNIILDAAIASNALSNSFDYLQLQILKNDVIVPWATGEDFSTVTSDTVGLTCSVDAMIHTSKGINGLRLDGVEDVYIKDLEVYDLVDTSPVGADLCGEYSREFRQTLPMQTGYSGNMNQAVNINAAQEVTIDGAYIHDIESHTGQAIGISIWPSNDITMKGTIKVENLKAGSQLALNTYEYTSLPNAAPEACGVRVYYQYGDYTTSYEDSEATYEIDSDSILGHVGCFGTDTKDLVSYEDFIDESLDASSSSSSMGDDEWPQPDDDMPAPETMPARQRVSRDSTSNFMTAAYHTATENNTNMMISGGILASLFIATLIAIRSKCGENKFKQLNAQWNGYETI